MARRHHRLFPVRRWEYNRNVSSAERRLRLSQRRCWRYTSFGTSKKKKPWRWRRYDLSKRRKSL